MTETLLLEGKVLPIPAATADGQSLWLSQGELPLTGWELKPEGLCRGELCVPIPPGRESEFTRPGAVNLAAFARHLGQPVLHDEQHNVWSIGQSPDERNASRRTLVAPDFTLPDLEGREHAIADYKGRKVLLVSWASW